MCLMSVASVFIAVLNIDYVYELCAFYCHFGASRTPGSISRACIHATFLNLVYANYIALTKLIFFAGM